MSENKIDPINGGDPPGPCDGECLYRWNAAMKKWEFISGGSTCQCYCIPYEPDGTFLKKFPPGTTDGEGRFGYCDSSPHGE